MWQGIRFAWLGALVACGSVPPPATQASPLLETVVPNFESKTLGGNSFDSGSFYERPLVMSFVSPDCAACDRTLRAAQAMYGDLHDVVVIGVFRDAEKEDALRMQARDGLRFPIIVDANGSLSRRFKVDAVPTTFVADRNGRVHWVGGSTLTEDGLMAAVQTVR
ncbi:MAG TPA: TlpA disulfide reductase family protein [Polyangiaceae bacterium]|jgi:peroxiredoxin